MSAGPGRAGAGWGRPGSGRAGGRVGVSAAVAVWGDRSSPPAPCPWSREAASRCLLVARGWILPHLVMVSTRTSGFSGSCAGGTRWTSPLAGDTCPSPESCLSELPSVVPRSDSALSRWSGQVQAQRTRAKPPPDLTPSSAVLQARN